MTTVVIEKNAYKNYACVAGEPHAHGARCQEAAVDNQRCKEHQDADQFPEAANPTKIQVNLTLPESAMSEELRAVLSTQEHEGFVYQPEGKARVLAQATAVGRDPYRYNEDMPSTGSLVFSTPSKGKWNGAINITAPNLLDELYSSMSLVGMELWTKSHRGKATQYPLKLTFSATQERQDLPYKFVLTKSEISGLMTMTWQKVFVYANIPAEDGTVLHTVHFTGPQTEISPRGTLRYANGKWTI